MVVWGVFSGALRRECGPTARGSDIFQALPIMTVKGVDAQEPLEYVLRTFDRP
jgi:hypothetical protein